MNDRKQFLGIVELGKLNVLWPEPMDLPVEVYVDSMVVGHPLKPLDLDEYEGRAVMVVGDAHGGAIYSAEKVEATGPIVTELVKRVFG